MNPTTMVSAFDAKTYLSKLLRETEQGHSFVIRRRGKPVAQLVPPMKEEAGPDFARLAAQFREIRKRMPCRLKIRQLIEEGRRY